MKNQINVVFFGTPWIAKECLEELFNLENINIQAVVCQPDKQKNRKNQFVYCETKLFALEHNIKVFQPEKIKDIFNELKDLNPDLILTCAYGQFVPETILNIPKYKCVNVHASLLPKLRGGAPIHWAIINGLKETGITLMYMVKEMDAGNIIYQQSIPITNCDTYKSLLIKLANLAREMIKKHFYSLVSDQVVSKEQNPNEVTFGFNIKKQEEYLDFNNSAEAIDHLIRGLNDKPLAKAIYKQNVYKIYEATILDKSNNKPNQIVSISNKGLEVSTKTNNILITKLQAPNKKVMSFKDYLNGNNEFELNTSFDVFKLEDN